MKKSFFILILLCLIGRFTVQSQNPYWVLNSLAYDAPANSMSTLPGNPNNVCLRSNNNGLFDAAGNVIFYVANSQILNRFGGVIHNISLSYNTECAKNITIVPVPGGTCGHYYVLYTALTGNSYNSVTGYEVGIIRLAVDASLNTTFLGVNKFTYPEFSLASATSSQMAVGKESNGTRRMFVGLRRSAGQFKNNNDQILEFKIDNNWLTPVGSFLSANTNISFKSHTLEISPDQRYLAWVQDPLGTTPYQLTVKDIIVDTVGTLVPSLTVDKESEIEFAANSNELYITTENGVALVDLSNNTYNILANSNTYTEVTHLNLT